MPHAGGYSGILQHGASGEVDVSGEAGSGRLHATAVSLPDSCLQALPPLPARARQTRPFRRAMRAPAPRDSKRALSAVLGQNGGIHRRKCLVWAGAKLDTLNKMSTAHAVRRVRESASRHGRAGAAWCGLLQFRTCGCPEFRNNGFPFPPPMIPLGCCVRFLNRPRLGREMVWRRTLTASTSGERGDGMPFSDNRLD